MDPALGEGYGVVGSDSLESRTLIFFFLLLLCMWAGQNELLAEVEMSAWPDCTCREIPPIRA